MVKISLPPPQRASRPVYYTLPPSSRLLRIYHPSPYGYRPTSFRYDGGPKGRFDHHENASQAARGMHYSALDLAGCLLECYGDYNLITVNGRNLGSILTLNELILLDLRGDAAYAVGANQATCKSADYSITQSWSRYFYRTYSSIHGLIYGNAHNDMTSIALYERAEQSLVVEHDIPLTHQEIRYRLLREARSLGMLLE